MKWRFFYVLGGILVLAMAAVSAQARDTQRVIVQFKAGKDEAKVKEKVEKHGGRVKRRVRKGKGSLAVVETAEPVGQAVEKFKKDPDVEFAEPDWIVRHQGIAVSDVISPQALANDPYYSAGYLWRSPGFAGCRQPA